MQPKNASLAESLSDEIRGEEAFNEMLHVYLALLPEEIMLVNLDIPSVVRKVLGARSKITALRHEIAELPNFNLANIDSLEKLAFGLSYADVQWRSAVKVFDPLPTLLKEAIACRTRLKADISTLIARRVIDPATLSGYSGRTGYRRVAGDLLLLVAVITDHWTQAQSKCGCEEAELEQAEQLANHLLRRLGQREQAPPVTTSSADLRARAFTALVRAYDEVRRAVCYLRWSQGDAAIVAPSLYAGRHKKTEGLKGES